MRKFFLSFIIVICAIVGIHKCVRYYKINKSVDEIIQKFETGDEKTRIRYAEGLLRMNEMDFYHNGIFEEHYLAPAPEIIDRLTELGCQYKAFEYIESLAQKGYVEQQVFLAHMYFCGKEAGYPCNKNYEKSFYWYNEAAKRGSRKAICALAYAYIYGYGVDKDAEKGVEIIRELAEFGYAEAQAIYGCLFEEGVEYYDEEKGWTTLVPKDTVLAKSWWRKAYENGDIAAKIHLGFTARELEEMEKVAQNLKHKRRR